MKDLEKTNLVVIPQEVTNLAEKVASEKREEVNTILNQLFSGTENWKQQIANIKVKDHTDNMSMQMADAARLNVKKARLEAEKLFDSKREEVQRVKLEYDLEDKLWLKSKQIMQEMFKSLEQEAEYKANTAKRYDIEQKEKRTQERLEKVIVYNPTVSRFDIENLSDEMFNVFLSGLEKEYNDRIEAERKAEEERIEKERILKLHEERKEKAIPFYNFWSDSEKTMNFGLLSEKNFASFLGRLEKAKSDYIAEQEKQRKENERLRLEAEAKQKEIDAANAKAEQERKEAEAKLKQEQENAAREKAKLEAELKAKKDAEERVENEKRIAAEKAQKEAEKLAKAPIKKQLDVWVNSFSISTAPIENEASKLISEKFNSFKNWALQQIDSL